MTEETVSPRKLVAEFLARHDWRRDGARGDPPKSRARAIWEDWIENEPEKAWPIFLEFVRVRPTDDDILELVWRRLRQLLKRHGRAFHARVLELVGSNDRLTRIAPPNEL